MKSPGNLCKLPVLSTDFSRSLFFAFLIVNATSALAADICWIDHVEKSQFGVKIYFSSPRRINIKRHTAAADEAAQTVMVDPRAGDDQKDYSGRPVQKFVALSDGDIAFASNVPEDSCSMTVVDKDGVAGVKAAAAFHLPRLPANNVEKFIPAL